MQILKFLFTVIGVLGLHTAQAQIKFFRTYTNNGYDYGEGVVQLADSSYLITGSSSSFEEAPAQAFLLKVDKLGNYEWSRPYGGAESDWGRRVFAVPNDGIYVAGYTDSYGAGAYDYYFFKTDWSGNLLWEKTIGEAGWERLNDAVMLPDTSFILIGETTSTGNEVEDLYVARINKFGDELWMRKIGGDGADIGRAVKMLNDTTIVIAGEYYVADSLTYKALLVRMHIDGTTEWQQIYGATDRYGLNDLYIDNDEIRAVGYKQVLDPFTLRQDYRLITDAAGAVTVEESTPKEGDFLIGKITKYGSEGKYYLVFEATDVPEIPTYTGGGSDILAVRYNDDLSWDQAFYNPSNLGHDQCNQLIPTSDGGAVFVGYNSNAGLGGSNVILVKLGENDNFPTANSLPIQSHLVSVEEILTPGYVQAYPNPVRDLLKLESIVAGSKRITVCDAFGKVVLQSSFESQLTLDFGTMAPGIYFLEVSTAGGHKTVRIVKE
jgi:hypothetical protein